MSVRSILCVTQYVAHSAVMNSSLFENLRLELRRGCLVLAVLGQLQNEHYGYTLRKALAEQGIEIDEGTLYPLLRRLEAQGLLASEWREEAKRNKRFYRLTEEGFAIFEQLLQEWRVLNLALDQIAKDSLTR
jgi:PadR family transcriptional regulator, regulatory protein PadR